MTEQRLYLKTAAIGLIVGSVTAFASRLAHGDLPAADPGAALRFITSHPFYTGVHLGAIVGVVIAAGGLVALAGTLQQPVAALLGRLGTASVLVGTAVFATDFATDGRAGQSLAEAWRAASATDQADLIGAAHTVFTALQGPSVIAISLLWGLPLVLFGRAQLPAQPLRERDLVDDSGRAHPQVLARPIGGPGGGRDHGQRLPGVHPDPFPLGVGRQSASGLPLAITQRSPDSSPNAQTETMCRSRRRSPIVTCGNALVGGP